MSTSTAQTQTRVLHAPESLGLLTREEFREEANGLLDQMGEGRGQLIVDLGMTTDIDSAGLSALVMVHRHATDRRQQVVLQHVSPEIEFLLVLTKMDDLFIFANAERKAGQPSHDA